VKNDKQLGILKEVVVHQLKAVKRQESREEDLIRLTVNPPVITCYLQKERGQRKKKTQFVIKEYLKIKQQL
jgi:hypothetical protein